MFRQTILAMVLAGAFISACKNEMFIPSYHIELPPVPSAWISLLGEPHWRLEWISPHENKEILEIERNQMPSVQILQEWTTPVIAYPFWPNHHLLPGVMRPAGALFPFDSNGDRIYLTWQGGVDAMLYLELAAHAGEGTLRQPHYFNWPRFRALLKESYIDEAVRNDPWSADWKKIAIKTVQSGFNHRRIVHQPLEDLLVPVSYSGPWITTSPFAEPVNQQEGKPLCFQVSENIETYLSAAGMLRCTKGAWVWLPWDTENAVKAGSAAPLFILDRRR